MTRINTIDPALLLDQHLMAEYRELPMVMGSLSRSRKTAYWNSKHYKIPENYTLNAGHVKFFYYRQTYLWNRWCRLIRELEDRGYRIYPESRVLKWEAFEDLPDITFMPDSNDHRINIERIIQRLKEKPDFYTYQGKKVFIQHYEDTLNKMYL